jgi:transposase
MWTPEHRRAAERSGLRYPSDLTDAEWAIVEPMIPPARRRLREFWAKRMRVFQPARFTEFSQTIFSPFVSAGSCRPAPPTVSPTTQWRRAWLSRPDLSPTNSSA